MATTMVASRSGETCVECGNPATHAGVHLRKPPHNLARHPCCKQHMEHVKIVIDNGVRDHQYLACVLCHDELQDARMFGVWKI